MVTALDGRTSSDVCAVAGGRGGISDINTGDTTYQPDTATATLLHQQPLQLWNNRDSTKHVGWMRGYLLCLVRRSVAETINTRTESGLRKQDLPALQQFR